MDDMRGAIGEAGRVLEPGGRLCLAIVHPINSAGAFVGEEPDSPFVISGSYLEQFRYTEELERDGLAVTMTSDHRPLEAYFEALAVAGFVVERLREPAVPDEAVGRPRQRRCSVFHSSYTSAPCAPESALVGGAVVRKRRCHRLLPFDEPGTLEPCAG